MRFAALRAKWFPGYIVGGGLLMTGDQVEHAITYLVMWQHFQSPLLAGFAVVSHWAPHLLLSVVLGGLADRFDCRRIVQVGLGLFVLASVGWALAIGFDVLEPWMCVALLIVHGLASAVWAPAGQLLIYDIVGPEQLPGAVRLNATALQLGMLAGPAAGAVLLFTVGPVAGLLLNLLFYVPFTLYLLRVPLDGHVRGGRPGERLTLRQTFSVVGDLPRHPAVLLVVVLQGAVAALFGLAIVPLLPAFGELLGLDDSGLGYGMLLVAMAVGAVAGGIGFEAIGRVAPSLRLTLGATLLFAVCLAVFAFSPSFPLTIAALVVAGAASIVSATTSTAIVQLEAPADRRGRFIGIYNTTSMGLRVLSGVLVGGLAALLGVQAGVGIPALALVVIVAALIAATRMRAIRASRSARS